MGMRWLEHNCPVPTYANAANDWSCDAVVRRSLRIEWQERAGLFVQGP